MEPVDLIPDYLNMLPQEMWRHILEFVPENHHTKVRAVCCTFFEHISQITADEEDFGRNHVLILDQKPFNRDCQRTVACLGSQRTQVKTVYFYSEPFDTQEIAFIFDKLSHITSLLLEKRSPSNEGTANPLNFSFLRKLKNLEGLKIVYPISITPQAFSSLDGVCLTNLKKLSFFSSYQVNTTHLTHFLITSQMPSLKWLEITDHSYLTGISYRILNRFSKLKSLDLSSNVSLSPDDLLANLSLNEIKTLNLSHLPELRDNHLSSIHRLTRLKNLFLSCCPLVTDNGIKHLTPLTSLKALRLSLNETLSDQSLESVAKLISLEWLNLYGLKEVTNTGIEQLTSLTHLVDLDISRMPLVTDGGIKSVESLLNLREFKCSYCPKITYLALDCLKTLPCLEDLYIRGCEGIKDTDIIFFKKCRPRIRLFD